MAIPNTGQLIDKIQSVLAADGTLTALLGTFESLPCVFSGRLVPSSAPRPFVSIRPLSGLSMFDTKDKRGLVFQISIGCYTDEEETTIVLEQICDQVMELLHRQDLTLTTDDMIRANIIGYVPAPTDDFLTGAIITFEFLVMEN